MPPPCQKCTEEHEKKTEVKVSTAYYAKTFEEKPELCGRHAKGLGYVNVLFKSKMCKQCMTEHATDSTVIPVIANFAKTFNDPAELCARHSSGLGYLNVTNKKLMCIACMEEHKSNPDVIPVRANFAKTINEKVELCFKHARGLDYVYVASKFCSQCLKETEKTQGLKPLKASFAKSFTDKPELCGKHADGLGYFDVIHKMCSVCMDAHQENPDFKPIRAGFAKDFGVPAELCANHAEGLDYICVTATYCVECLKNFAQNPSIKPIQACFAEKLGRKATLCNAHADGLGYVDVQNKCKLCPTCQVTRGQAHLENKCSRCFAFENPGNPLVRHYKTKQNEVEAMIRAWIDARYPQSWAIYDKNIGACSKRRPDVFLEFENFVIIVEVDENQHNGYGAPCEATRMNEIWHDIAFRTIVLIRFNPDDYVAENGASVGGCFFSPGPRSKLQMVDNGAPLRARVGVLLDVLEQKITSPPADHETIHLFFDGNAPPSSAGAAPKGKGRKRKAEQ
jgi:hypothetical protein